MKDGASKYHLWTGIVWIVDHGLESILSNSNWYDWLKILHHSLFIGRHFPSPCCHIKHRCPNDSNIPFHPSMTMLWLCDLLDFVWFWCSPHFHHLVTSKLNQAVTSSCNSNSCQSQRLLHQAAYHRRPIIQLYNCSARALPSTLLHLHIWLLIDMAASNLFLSKDVWLDSAQAWSIGTARGTGSCSCRNVFAF